MNPILRLMLATPELANVLPRSVRAAARGLMRVDEEYDYEVRRRLDPYVGTPCELEYETGSECTVGIAYDPAHYHQHYQSACIDLGISYKVVDLFRSDWTTALTAARTDVLLVWPPLKKAIHKELIDERVRSMQVVPGVSVYPDAQAIYLLDSKLRVRDWLVVNGFHIPATSCFVRTQEAFEFLHRCDYPIVFKSLRGGVSSGVVICRSRREALALTRRCFGSGFTPRRGERHCGQRGVVLFQEYLPDVGERRIIRVGDSYLAIDKVRRGDFHSGSGTMRWAAPSRDNLDLVRKLTERGGFRCMNVDLFLTKDGRTLVNELHAVFGGPKIESKESMGRHLYDAAADRWTFEPGGYYRNYCCNLRVMDALRLTGYQGAFRMDWVDKEPFELASPAETTCSQST
jgi:hypothetical protein